MSTTTEEQQGLEPGMHEGLPMSAYLADPAISASQLLEFDRSPTPAHYRAKMDAADDSSSKAQDLGSAAHDLILEPESFGERNAQEPDIRGPDLTDYKNPRATNAYKDKVAELIRGRPNVRILTAEQWAAVHQMRDEVMGHPAARKLLEQEGPVEVVGIWDDPDTGLRYRIRPDKPAVLETEHGPLGTCVDLKTTRAGDLDGFRKQIDDRGYAFKAAFYRLVLYGLDFPWTDHVCITVENFAPYLAACRGIHPDWIDMEEPRVLAAMRGLAECRASGRWPKYPREIEYVNAPDWKLKRAHDVDFLDFDSAEAA